MLSLIQLFPVLVSASGAAVAAAMVPAACSGELPLPQIQLPQTPVPAQDTLLIQLLCEEAVSHTDILVYSDSLVHSLVAHVRMRCRDTLLLVPRSGQRIVTAIANCPYALNIKALGRMDSAELLESQYCEENPELPVMSGISFGGAEFRIALSPLLCRVRLLEVENRSGAALENVQVALSGVNAAAQILRHDGFRPALTIEGPCEIAFPVMMRAGVCRGLGPDDSVYPLSELFAYPSDSPPGLGVAACRIVLSASSRGSQLSWSGDLPPLERAGRVCARVRVFSESAARWDFFTEI